MNALWTAGRHNIPARIAIVNSRPYYNDEFHQQGAARRRNHRDLVHRIEHPAPTSPSIADAQDVVAIGPLKR